MQKQKTIAKWLAILMLCTVGIGSYLLYDAFAHTDNSSTAREDDAQPQNPPAEEPPREKYYTTLPREAEKIQAFTAAHVGGEDADTLHTSVTVDDKTFLFFSSQSEEYDVREKGLCLALFEDNTLLLVNRFTDGKAIDCKLTANGIAVVVKEKDRCELYLFDTDGNVTAQTEMPTFDSGRLYLKDKSLWWFYTVENRLRACQILNNFTLQISAYFATAFNASIKEILPTADGFTLFVNHSGGDDSNSYPYAVGYNFEPYNGFNMQFSYDKLQIEQIIVIAGDVENYVVMLARSNAMVLISFASDYSETAIKTINDCTSGAIFKDGDGLLFVGNGLTLSLCRHLDVLSIKQNNLSFDSTASVCSDKYGFMLCRSDDTFSLYSAKGDYLEIFTLPDCTSPRLYTKADRVYFIFSSTYNEGLCRANFGVEDAYVLSFPATFDIDT